MMTRDALWNKSKLFVDKALRARDINDDQEYYVWASIAMELLGKAALAHIHPVLVADPTHFQSLLAACGRSTTVDTKSITARTVYERVKAITPEFDERMSRECMNLASRRNAELHSGDAPTVGLDVRAWVPAFWRAADVLCRCQQSDLEAWLGPDEAGRVRAILADAAELARQTVLARIDRRRREFDSRFPRKSRERHDLEIQNASRSLPARYLSLADAFDDVECPACSLKAWSFGYEQEEEILEEPEPGYYDEDYPPEELVRTTYGVDSFRCIECNLVLDGRDEIEIAGLPDEFAREEFRVPAYEDDYGNE